MLCKEGRGRGQPEVRHQNAARFYPCLQDTCVVVSHRCVSAVWVVFCLLLRVLQNYKTGQ